LGKCWWEYWIGEIFACEKLIALSKHPQLESPRDRFLILLRPHSPLIPTLSEIRCKLVLLGERKDIDLASRVVQETWQK